MKARTVAAVDIGSNSVRLVLYRLEGRAVWTLFNEKVLAGLGRDIAETGRLSVEGVEQALQALGRFADLIEAEKPERVFVAATAAVREAADGPEFCRRVKAETGLKVRILSGEDEARYAALGVIAGIPRADGVAADLGGSSLELTQIKNGKLGDGVSLKLGPFAFGHEETFDPKARGEAILKGLKGTGKYRTGTLYAVGGAWRALAQLHMALDQYPLHILDQYSMTASEVRRITRLVAQQSRTSLEKWPGVSRKRADTLPHAALVLAALVDKLEVETVVISAWGVREGLISEAFSSRDAALDPLLEGLNALGARQALSHDLAPTLERWIAPVAANLSPPIEPRRIAAVCRVADIGSRLHTDHRAELTFDQVLRAPVPGQTHADRAWIASVVNARYAGPADTPDPVIIERLLDEEARDGARVIGLALRLACDLSGRAARVLDLVRIRIEDGRLILTPAPGHEPLLTGEQTRKRARALAEAMGLQADLRS